VVAFGRAELNLADPPAIRGTVRTVAPDVIVNAAAYTAVDKAETDSELAFAVNGAAPGVLAEEARSLRALLVHYSTDYVFDGCKDSPYTEEDAAAPLNVYGASKLEGERAVSAAGGAYLILRTSWVYAPRGRNFLLTMLRLAGERTELRVVDDQIGAPTSARAIAEATARILGMGKEANGLFHLSAGGSTSWFGFARAIIAATEGRRAKSPKLIPISTAEYGAPAARPRNSVLSNEKFRRAFGFELPSWQDQLTEALA
jgi:dTDP-4-dehydrorhamnose reductase